MKAMNRWGTLRGLGTSLAAAMVASVAVTTPMMTTAQGKQETGAQNAPTPSAVGQFTEQALAEGLTTEETALLQRQVNRVITEMGGTQIAVNQVLWPGGGGDTTVPLPGEKRARTLGEPEPQARNCPQGNLCVWEGANFNGPRHRMWECRVFYLPYYYYSWENNQTPYGAPETVARFYGDEVYIPPDFTPDPKMAATPPAHSWNRNTEVGIWASFVEPCR